MSRLAEVIRSARVQARLGEAVMAALVDLDPARVRQLEEGDVEPRPEELEAYAQVFGVSMRGFVQGEAKQAPLTQLFYRSASEGGLAALQEVAATAGPRVIGEFMRCVREVDELEALVGRPASQTLPVPPQGLSELGAAPPHGADRLADWFRDELGLGRAPIDSMRTLMTERLGIQVFWVTPEDLDPVIDGASTGCPRAAILVNLVEGPECWWRTRMTLGHELCHLLCDQGTSAGRFAIFSPHALKHTKARWNLFNGFERIERRAGAFAACLLAPESSVRRLVGARDPTSEETITAVGKEFGLGRTTAVNRLQQVFHLSKQVRLGIDARSARHWTSEDHPDDVRDGIGLRTGVVKELALEAFASGLLDRVRVREFLRLPLTEPLPEHPRVTQERRAPVRRVEDTVRGIAQAYLNREIEDVQGCFAASIEPAAGGWRVEVRSRTGDATDSVSPRGHVIVSYDLNTVESRVDRSVLADHGLE